MSKDFISLFDTYSSIPYPKSKSHLDKVVNKEDYSILYDKFSKIILSINKSFEKKFFENDFFFSSKNLVILEPHLFAFDILLKSITLNNLLEKYSNSKIILTVFEEEITYGNRFLNQYAYVASKIGPPFIMKSKGFYNNSYINNPASENKILSLLNFEKEKILFEIKKKLGIRKRKLYLNYGRNYITREIEFELFKKGYSSIELKKTLIRNYKTFSPREKKNIIDNQYIFNVINKSFSTYLKKHIKYEKVRIGFIKTITELFTINIQELIANKNHIRSQVKILKENNNIEFCLSNGLFHNIGKSVYDAMKFNDIKVFTVEHGLTNGISKDSLTNQYISERNTSDVLFCYNDASRDFHKKHSFSKTKFYSVGSHSFSKKILNKNLLRFFYRKKFKVKRECIFYVSHNIELNVGKYYPYTKPCSEIFQDEKNLISTLSKVNKQVIYKPYPTKQFIADRNTYLNQLIYKYDNIKFIEKEEDFRYMRNIADVIITQSSESTLEWCIGVEKPLVFLDSKNYEPLLDENVINAFKKSFFFFNYDKKGWEKDLIKFLNKPYSEIFKLWEEKKYYRVKYDNIYFLSKKKNAGEISTKYILKSEN